MPPEDNLIWRCFTVDMKTVELLVRIFDALTPENQDVLLATLEEAVRIQEASAGSPH